MSYRIAGIDVHKKMLAVVICDVEIAQLSQLRVAPAGRNLRRDPADPAKRCGSRRLICRMTAENPTWGEERIGRRPVYTGIGVNDWPLSRRIALQIRILSLATHLASGLVRK